MKTYTAKNGNKQFMPSQGWLTRAIEGDENAGFCLACGDEQDTVEPDARRYKCDECKRSKVYGAEVLMVMGLMYDASKAEKPKGILRAAVDAKAAAVRHDAIVSGPNGAKVTFAKPERPAVPVISMREALIKQGLDPDPVPKPKRMSWLHGDRIIPGVADKTELLPGINTRKRYWPETAAKDLAFLAKGDGGTAQYVQLFCQLNNLIY
jgi:hypothetical protein